MALPWRPHSESADTSHVVPALPSSSIGESLLSHYGERLMALEHRYLVSLFVPQRIQQTHIVMVISEGPTAAVLDYDRSLVRHPDRMGSNPVGLALPDSSPRRVAAKLLGLALRRRALPRAHRVPAPLDTDALAGWSDGGGCTRCLRSHPAGGTAAWSWRGAAGLGWSATVREAASPAVARGPSEATQRLHRKW